MRGQIFDEVRVQFHANNICAEAGPEEKGRIGERDERRRGRMNIRDARKLQFPPPPEITSVSEPRISANTC